MKYVKVTDVKSPTRAHATDAGVDFFVPNNIQPIIMKVGDAITIPLGIKVLVPVGKMLKLTNKSGIASKKGLLVGACVIDSDYRGVIHLNLHKVSGEPITINPGDKIVQGILQDIDLVNYTEITLEDYLKYETDRGEGGFGSSGTV